MAEAPPNGLYRSEGQAFREGDRIAGIIAQQELQVSDLIADKPLVVIPRNRREVICGAAENLKPQLGHLISGLQAVTNTLGRLMLIVDIVC